MLSPIKVRMRRFVFYPSEIGGKTLHDIRK